ncbi:hypothetical protein Y1Q_0021722 [Alligator mississippiensis]|uniref:Uncharacterized protein n=1 Tax=Alligator mississippiensis TaxID=8496 RepID=A0A151PAV8_ALLMI|nr:hypothetical protein Y1Q_0021722 [Alligator mississippiensis]
MKCISRAGLEDYIFKNKYLNHTEINTVFQILQRILLRPGDQKMHKWSLKIAESWGVPGNRGGRSVTGGYDSDHFKSELLFIQRNANVASIP